MGFGKGENFFGLHEYRLATFVFRQSTIALGHSVTTSASIYMRTQSIAPLLFVVVGGGVVGCGGLGFLVKKGTFM